MIAMISIIQTLPTIKMIAYEGKKMICLYIHIQIKKKKISKTFINISTIIKLIS